MFSTPCVSDYNIIICSIPSNQAFPFTLVYQARPFLVLILLDRPFLAIVHVRTYKRQEESSLIDYIYII